MRLASAIVQPYRASPEQLALVARGYARIFPDSTETRDLARRMHRNPLEHVRRLVIECTSRCNYSCSHCYNAGVERTTETKLEALSSAIDTFAGMGVREFAFIGGEVTKYGDGWLDLAEKARGTGAAIVSVLSNGWFLGGEDFEAAGRRYPDDDAYLRDLKAHGVTHVGFSIDGRREAHDASRGIPGFYRPSPQLTIKANGELATCRLADAGEGYGNIHERPLLDILNGMQDSFIYRLHAGRRIGEYLCLVDPDVFGRRFAHLCALRAVTTMIARRMHDQFVEPDDAEGVARINREVALVTGRTAGHAMS